MSLVNEALKRARTQAAVQQTGDAPLRQVVMPIHYSEPKKSIGPAVWIAALGCSLFVIVGASVLCVTYLTKVQTQANAPAATADPAPVVASVSVVPPRVSLPTPSASTEVVTPAVPAASPAPVQPKPVQPDPVPADPATATAPVAAAIGATPTQPTAPAAPIGLTEGKVYMQSIDFPDVPKVKLDGILWSDKNPVAIINGITSAPGEDLDGVTVVAIEPKRVKLGTQGKEFFIRLP